MKKEKWTKIGLIVGIIVLVLLVIITSIVINNQKRQLEDLNNKNDQVKPEEGTNLLENKIILKNIEIFIDIS